MNVHRREADGTLLPDGREGFSMETETRSAPMPMILGIVGGLLLMIGTLLNWVTASFNDDKIVAELGIDPSRIPAGFRAQVARVTGWDLQAGKWLLVVGVVVVVASALLVIASSRRAVAFVVIFGGAVGGSMALYKATAGKDGMVDDAARALTGAPLPGNLSAYVSITVGIGLWLCVAGGAVAIIAGIMAMVTGGPSATPTAVMPSGPIPAVEPPAAPPPGVAPGVEPPVEPPAVAPPAAPAAGSGTGMPPEDDPSGTA
jgi:hypothetical protein